jgi:hypothetical protein
LLVAAMAVDDAVIARAPAPPRRSTQATLQPTILLGASAALVSVGGLF